MSKVKVTIFGREYTITGKGPEAEIRKIAETVDAQMRDVEENSPYDTNIDIALLTALNLSETIFDMEEKVETARLEKDQATRQAEKVKSASLEVEEKIPAYEAKIKQLQTKCDEFESNFFDLQMQNIKLKNELDKLRGSANTGYEPYSNNNSGI